MKHSRQKIIAGPMPILITAFLLMIFTVPCWGGGLEYYQKGRAEEKAGNRLGAIKSYSLAIQAGDLSKDKLAYTYHRRASIRGFFGQSSLGISDYSKSIELNPRSGTSYSLRGYLLGVLGEYDLAQRDHLAAKALSEYSTWDSYLPWVLQHYADLWRRKGHYEKALEYCDKALKVKNYATVYFRRAWIYSNMGQYPLVRVEFEKFKKAMEKQKVSFNVFWADERAAIERLKVVSQSGQAFPR